MSGMGTVYTTERWLSNIANCLHIIRKYKKTTILILVDILYELTDSLEEDAPNIGLF